MNTLLTKSALSAAIAFTLAACGGSDSGGIAGIGGSGYTSSGSVTGFGSVFVNGVEFETGSATFDIDDSGSGSQDDLAIGMVVKVNGSINDDGVSGTATSISFDDELQGPVTSLSIPDADGIKRTFIVLGTTVIIDSGSTTFDISGKDNVPPGTVFDFDTITTLNNVEISGFFDSNGNLQATRVELKNIAFDANSIVEIKGTISNVSGTTFKLGNLTVDASLATLDDLPSGLVNDQLVEVKGTFNTGTNTISATKVEAENNSVDDTDEFELEGIITDYVDDSSFKIGGISVNASNVTTREPATLILANDLHIEAEGAIINGTLVANKIKLEDGTIKVHASVSSVNVAANTFTVTPVLGQPPITVTVTTDTQLQDDVNEIEPYTLTHLFNNPGFVEIRGFDDGSGGITATEVDVKEADDVIVQGNLQVYTTNTSIQLLGVTFAVDAGGETDFEDDMDIPFIDEAAFEAAAPPGTLVKVKDKEINGVLNGVADEIDIETP